MLLIVLHRWRGSQSSTAIPQSTAILQAPQSCKCFNTNLLSSSQHAILLMATQLDFLTNVIHSWTAAPRPPLCAAPAGISTFVSSWWGPGACLH
jgi:hypothetical protein